MSNLTVRELRCSGLRMFIYSNWAVLYCTSGAKISKPALKSAAYGKRGKERVIKGARKGGECSGKSAEVELAS